MLHLTDGQIISIYGTPWLPDQNDWAFSATEPNELTRLHSKIPTNVDILITHGPPAGVLDQNNRGQSIGCSQLFNAVSERVKPRLHVFGHCHEAYGLKIPIISKHLSIFYLFCCVFFSGSKMVDGLSTLFVNASSCNGENNSTV
jgi:hypothetical protein